jgi:AcrR family transcriptional regulator
MVRMATTARTTKRQQQSEATRRSLLRVARRLFAKRGYGGTSIEDIQRGAKVTRGALYHHFPSKQAIFRAVFEEVSRELNERADAAAAGAPAERRLEAGVGAFLDACLDRDVQQIMLLDGPSVLGWDTCVEIDAQYALGSLRAALRASMSAGHIAEQPVDPLAQLLLGALNQAALVIARADDVVAARTEVGATVERLLGGLRA